jgi:hypothetical protein
VMVQITLEDMPWRKIQLSGCCGQDRAWPTIRCWWSRVRGPGAPARQTREEALRPSYLQGGQAMVQLGDRSWERIGRLVRTGYAGTVMSVDEHGQLVPRRVTGWHATPRGVTLTRRCRRDTDG